MTTRSFGLLHAVLERTERQSEHTAVWEADRSMTYGDLGRLASRIAAAAGTSPSHQFAAVLVERGAQAYGAVLGALWSGRPYCPLNPSFPAARNARMLDRSGADVLIVDAAHRQLAIECLRRCEHKARLVVIDGLPEDGLDPQPPGDLAYLLFTSGSTGEPKGVAITHANALHYLDHIVGSYGYDQSDRCSQTFDLTFDLSVHDIFCTLSAGATLVPFTRTHLMQPSRRIAEARLSVWFSVPSVAMMMRRLRLLRPDLLESLRLAFFCGEPLPVATARAWSEATPRASLVNLYGPTEATIACTEHVFDPQVEEGSYRAEVVPIGLPFPGLQVTLGEGNELLVGGPQIAPGYWQDPDLTGQKFLALPGSSEPWYRTGDVVERDDDGTLHFLGRVDSQLKIRGHRVELQEVESVLRKAVGHDLVLVVPFPVTEAGVEGLIACVESQGGQASDRSEEVLEFCRQLLAPYMVPSRVAWFDALPRNSNGKLDRIGCRSLIEQGA